MGRGVYQTCWLLLTLCLKDVLSGDWSVQLPSDPICTVVGSSVVLPCSYDYPDSSAKRMVPHMEGGAGSTGAGGEEYKVLSEMWCLGDSRCITPRYVFHSAGVFPDLSYEGRVEYLGEPGTKNCSLRISGLRASDSGTYVFYLVTSHPTQKIPQQAGLQLLVADSPSVVSVLSSPCGDIMEGVTLRLACCGPATNPDGRYSWYKTSSPTPGHDGQVWSMADIRATESDGYYCQMMTRDGAFNSSTVAVNVQYPPHNTAVSVSPARELPEGGAVTLTCSSNASPPVHTYTWRKGTGCPAPPGNNFYQGFSVTPRGRGQNFTIANFTTEEAGQYCCVATNRHGSQSNTVTLSINTAGSQSAVEVQRLVTVGVTIALLLAAGGTVAYIISRRRRSAPSHQSYILTETSPTAV